MKGVKNIWAFSRIRLRIQSHCRALEKTKADMLVGQRTALEG